MTYGLGSTFLKSYGRSGLDSCLLLLVSPREIVLPTRIESNLSLLASPKNLLNSPWLYPLWPIVNRLAIIS